MEIGTGHVVYAVFRWLFENILYVYVIYRLGLFVGGVVMTLLSFAACSSALFLYQQMRIDWIGIGTLANLANIQNPRLWQRILARAMLHGSVVIFLALSILQDPFITTAYFRYGRFGSLVARDWNIFFSSVLVGNIYWTLRSGVVVAIIENAWHRLAY